MQRSQAGAGNVLAGVYKDAGGGRVVKTSLQFHEESEFLRESSGTTNIERTILKAVKVLALFQIPHYVYGGFAGTRLSTVYYGRGYYRAGETKVEVDLLRSARK